MNNPKNEELRDLYGVVVDDLIRNRQGNLSESQRQDLEEYGRLLVRKMFIVPAEMIFVLALAWTTNLFNPEPICIGTFVFLLAIVEYVICLKWRQIQADANNNVVMLVEGKAKVFRTFLGKLREECGMHIAGEQLDISPIAYQVFDNGEFYRVYFVPISKVVIAAEVVE